MKDCKYLTVIQQEAGSPLCKCDINNMDIGGRYGDIKGGLKNKNVIPNGECPYAYNGLDLSECPCFAK